MNSPFLLSGIFWTRNSSIFVLKSTFIKNGILTVWSYKYISVPKKSSVISISQWFFSQCISCIFEHKRVQLIFLWYDLPECFWSNTVRLCLHPQQPEFYRIYSRSMAMTDTNCTTVLAEGFLQSTFSHAFWLHPKIFFRKGPLSVVLVILTSSESEWVSEFLNTKTAF